MLDLKSIFALLKNKPAFDILVMLILLTYPALLLTVRNGMGVVLGVLLIISIVQLFRIRQAHPLPHWDGYSIAFSIAMASPVVAIFLSQAYHGHFNAPPYDWASRFLFAIPVFLVLRQTNIRAITVLQYGIPVGVLVSLAMLLIHPFDWGGRYTTSESFNLIHFSDTALMLGFLSLFSINWERKDHPLVITFKLCGLMAGMYMSIQSGERGGWLAMPVLLLIWISAHNKQKLWLKLCIAMTVILGTVWLGYSKLEVVHYRIDFIFSDISAYTQGNKDSSVGVRFQLYLTAIHLFIEHPIFGIGPGEFAHAMPALLANNMLTPLAAQMGTSEVHNEILHKCAETGVFGLLSILSVYLVPTVIFWRSKKSSEPSIRIASFMGICLVAGFFIFGLTVEIFDLKMTATFFAFTLAILMAAAMQIKAPEKVSSTQQIDSGIPNSHFIKTDTSLISARLNQLWHFAVIAFTPILSVLALTIAIVAVNKYQLNQAQLVEATIQIEKSSASLLAAQDELKNIRSERIQSKALLDEEQQQRNARIGILIQNINALQRKMKIHPTLEEQLKQGASAVTASVPK